MEKTVYIKTKRKLDVKIFSIVVLIFALFFIVKGFSNLDYVCFLIGATFIITCYYITRNIEEKGCVILNSKEMYINIGKTEYKFQWQEINSLQFQEDFSASGMIGLVLLINHRDNISPIWFYDFDISESKFKELVNEVSERNLFLDTCIKF